MSKFTSLIRRAPKRFSAVVAMVAAAIIVPVVVFAWGPDRPTFTVAQPSNHVTFDSITDNPNYGDERNAVTIKDAANTSAGGWTDDINVQNGKEYYVRMYVHNNAAENLNLVAHDVTARFNIPTQEAKRIQVDGYLSSSNADPKEIWDQAVFSSTSNFKINYVAGSAMYTNNVFTSGTSRPDTIVSSGTLLGYTSMNGDIPGCFKYSGFVTFKVKAVASDFDVQKTVRVNGATDTSFKESVAVKPGDKVDYQIYFKNTGGTQLTDVVIKDTLPAGVSYVPGTSFIHNANGTRAIPDGITAGGAVIGGYAPEGDAYLKFTGQVATNDQLPTCGPNTLKNVAKATTSVGSKEDTADVTVNKECKPQVKYTCDALSVSVISQTKFKFDTTYTVENATFKSVTYTVKDASGKVISTVTPPSGTATEYTQTTPGKYTVQSAVTVTVDGQDKTVTGSGCNGAFEVPSTPGSITVCKLDDKTIVTIKESDFDSSKYSKNLNDCTTTPPELPHTGIGENIVAVIGLGALVAGAVYYIASRRALNL